MSKTLIRNDFIKVEQTDESTLVFQWAEDDMVEDYMKYVLSDQSDMNMGLARHAVNYRADKSPDAKYKHRMTFHGVLMQSIHQWKRARKNMLQYHELSQFIHDVSLFMMMVQANSGVSLPYTPYEYIFTLEHVVRDPESGDISRITRFLPLFLSRDIQWCRVDDSSIDIPIVDTYRHTMFMPPESRMPMYFITSPEMDDYLSSGQFEDAETRITCASWLYSLAVTCVWLYKDIRELPMSKDNIEVRGFLSKEFLEDELDDIMGTPVYHTLMRCLNPDPKRRQVV